MTFHDRFGRNVRARRKQLDCTQAQLAKLAGLSCSFMSDLENGKRCVSLVNAVNVANALGVTLHYLLTEELKS